MSAGGRKYPARVSARRLPPPRMTRRDWGDVALLVWLAATLVVVGAAWFGVLP